MVSDDRLDDASRTVLRAGNVVAAHGLSDAFGHVSARLDDESFVITPPLPLGALTPRDRPVVVRLDATELPTAAPREAWMHLALYRRRPAVGAVVRVQPRAVAAMSAAHRPFLAVSGHAALLGEVADHADSRLVRDRDRAERLADAAGAASAVVVHGNGALTLAGDVAEAVALAWVLERTAELLLAAGHAARPLPSDEIVEWRALAPELLPRIHAHLDGSAVAPPGRTTP